MRRGGGRPRRPLRDASGVRNGTSKIKRNLNPGQDNTNKPGQDTNQHSHPRAGRGAARVAWRPGVWRVGPRRRVARARDASAARAAAVPLPASNPPIDGVLGMSDYIFSHGAVDYNILIVVDTFQEPKRCGDIAEATHTDAQMPPPATGTLLAIRFIDLRPSDQAADQAWPRIQPSNTSLLVSIGAVLTFYPTVSCAQEELD